MRSNSINRFAVSSAARAPSDEAFENSPNLASSSCPSKENSCFKDTISMNKSGTSDLSLEPQQMKRKKRGGKNNLRKSLAWDRAFFTEEGVLDPLELSAISGVSCRGGLSLINEDTPVISGQDEDFHKDKENDLPLPKLNLSSSNRVTSSSLLSHKVPLNAGSKLGSKCGDCPRPSPSLKRRVNANVGKATGTVLKLPKVTGLKPGLSPTCAANKRTILRRSHAKHDDITQPDFSIPTDVKLDSSFKSHRNVQNTSRATASLSASHSDGDLGNSSFNRHLSINMIPMTVDKDDSVSNTASVNVTKISQERSCDGQRYDSVPITTLYSQNAHNNGRTLRHLQNQTVRPSGLRMPSPSLSFFSQPKPSALWNMPLRNTSSDVYGSQNCGSSTLLDNLSRTTKYYDKIPDSRISSSKDKCYGSESTASTHASVIDLVKSRLDQKLIYESRALPTKNVIVRTSHEDSEVQNIATEISSQNGSQELTMNKFLKNAIDICHVKNESHERERRIAELVSKQNDSIPESQTVHEIDEQPEKNKTLNLLVLNNDSASTQGTDGFDYKVQNTSAMDSDWRKSSDKPDFHEVHLEKTDPLKYALGENEEGTAKNISEESATEQLVVYQQRGYCCNKSMKPSEQGEVVAESPYFESKNLQHPLKVLTDNLPAAGAPMHKFSFASIVEGYENESKMSEVGDDIKQPSESPEPQNFHQEVAMELRQVGKLNKRSSLPNLQQEENADELLIIAADRKDGDNMIDSRLSFSVSLGKRHKSNLSEERSITQLPRKMVGCDSVGNSFSSGNCNSSVNNSFDSDVDTSNGNWSDGVCQDNRSREIIDDSSLPESTIHPFSPQDTLIKEAEELPCIEVGSVDNLNVHTKTLPVQPLGSNMLNNCFFQKSERMALTDDKFVAENLVHSNDFMEAKNLLDVSSEDAFGGLNISVTNEVFQSNSRSSTPAKESPLTHEIFSEEYEIWDGIGVENAVTDPSRVEAFSDSIKVRVSEDNDRVETTDISNNDPVDGLDEKKHPSVVIPPNAAPFSDEWLAAIEAAGEDILTRKGGAVQNSPPDKSVPEPSPWSPVKRKNNQIGPFDCTKKFTAPSDSFK